MTQSVDLEMSQWLWFGGLVVISAGLPVMENKNKIIKPEALLINEVASAFKFQTSIEGSESKPVFDPSLYQYLLPCHRHHDLPPSKVITGDINKPETVDGCEQWWLNDRPDLESKSTGSPKGESNSRTLTMLEAIKDVEGFYNKHFGKISISHDRILRKHGLNSASNIVPLRKK